MWARLQYDRWTDETSKKKTVTANQKKPDELEWKTLSMIPQLQDMKEMLFKNMDHLKHIVELKKK